VGAVSQHSGTALFLDRRAESWTALGRLTLSALAVDDPTDGDIQATCRDLMAQTTAVVANHFARQIGEQVTSGDSSPASAPDTGQALVFTWSLDAGLMSMEGVVVWSEALLTRCAGSPAQPAAAETVRQDAIPPDTQTPQLGGHALDSIPRLDLRVKFVLGRTNMLLRDLFKLNVGSVIELDRSAVEPAEVVISGRLLAHGQVVVVNGNYGLKILPRKQ